MQDIMTRQKIQIAQKLCNDGVFLNKILNCFLQVSYILYCFYDILLNYILYHYLFGFIIVYFVRAS